LTITKNVVIIDVEHISIGQVIIVTAESGQGNNRLFIILSIALIGLICIGLMGLGGVLFVIQQNRSQEAAMLNPTATATPFPPTFTPTSTFTPTPTDTPEPTSTSTPVITTPEPEATAEVSSQDVGEVATVTLSAADLTATAQYTSVSTVTTEAPDAQAAATPDTGLPGSGGVLEGTTQQPVLWAGGLLVIILLAAGGVYWHRARLRSHG
jgi:cytoskeletal protein RodZ